MLRPGYKMATINFGMVPLTCPARSKWEGTVSGRNGYVATDISICATIIRIASSVVVSIDVDLGVTLSPACSEGSIFFLLVFIGIATGHIFTGYIPIAGWGI